MDSLQGFGQPQASAAKATRCYADSCRHTRCRPYMPDPKAIAKQAAGAAAERIPPSVAESVHYPDSDGHFLPDNPLQAHAVMNVRFGLQHHFDKVDNVVLEGDMFIYYEEGNPAVSIAPDVYVVLDHDLGDRLVYKFWEEGKPPDFALEVISPSSVVRNATEKRDLYARLRIGEYFLFQPDPRKRGQRLVGYRLWGTSYAEVPTDPDGAVHSTALGVSLRVEGANLRLRSLATGRDYAWIEENAGNIEAVQAKADAARARAEAAEAQVAAAQARAESEAEARQQVETRIAELEALLRQRA